MLNIKESFLNLYVILKDIKEGLNLLWNHQDEYAIVLLISWKMKLKGFLDLPWNMGRSYNMTPVLSYVRLSVTTLPIKLSKGFIWFFAESCISIGERKWRDQFLVGGGLWTKTQPNSSKKVVLGCPNPAGR